jgi:paired amphipathic helix protein Sin3a
MPTTEIDFSQCRRCTPSYRALPHNYPRGKCSGRTALCESVLNNNWVSVPTGSEDFGVKNLRRNQYEEALFKCEDDRYEIDMVMDANRSTIRALEPIAKNIADLDAAKSSDASSASTEPGKYQYRLDKRALTVMHLKAIARVYGDAGDRVLELLRKNPAGAIPVILARLKQKAVEWGKARQQLDKQWKEVLEKNYQKSLDHRSFYFKTSDRKAVMAKTMLQEAKVAKHKAELKAKRGEEKKTGGSNNSNTDATGMSSHAAVQALSHYGDPVTGAHMSFAMPDVEVSSY